MDIPFGMKMGELMGYQSHRATASGWIQIFVRKQKLCSLQLLLIH